MPVGLLTDRLVKWPDAEIVGAAATGWAESVGSMRDEVRAIGIFGSYACDDWGVGSDLDAATIRPIAKPDAVRYRICTTQHIVPARTDIVPARHTSSLHGPISYLHDAMRRRIEAYQKLRLEIARPPC